MKIRPRIFEEAADRIASGESIFTGDALYACGASEEEECLWLDMHIMGDTIFLLGPPVSENQVLREVLLRECALNLRRQGKSLK